MYNSHTLESFKELGLESQRVKKLASFTFCQLRCQTCAYQTFVFKYYYRLSSGGGFRSKPATLLIPIGFFLVEEFYGTRYQKGSFSLFNVGGGFHCLRSLYLFLTTLVRCCVVCASNGAIAQIPNNIPYPTHAMLATKAVGQVKTRGSPLKKKGKHC